MQYMNWENPFTNRIWMCSLTTSGLWRLLCVFECPVCSDVPQKLRPPAIRGIRGFFFKKNGLSLLPFSAGCWCSGGEKEKLKDLFSEKKLHPAVLQTLPLFNFLFIHSTNPNFPVVSAASVKYSTGLLDIFGWFCPGYSCITTWIIKYVWVSHFISHHIKLLRSLMCIFLFYFSQPSDPHHDITRVSYFRSFHIKAICHRLLFFVFWITRRLEKIHLFSRYIQRNSQHSVCDFKTLSKTWPSWEEM